MYCLEFLLIQFVWWKIQTKQFFWKEILYVVVLDKLVTAVVWTESVTLGAEAAIGFWLYFCRGIHKIQEQKIFGPKFLQWGAWHILSKLQLYSQEILTKSHVWVHGILTRSCYLKQDCGIYMHHSELFLWW